MFCLSCTKYYVGFGLELECRNGAQKDERHYFSIFYCGCKQPNLSTFFSGTKVRKSFVSRGLLLRFCCIKKSKCSVKNIWTIMLLIK